MSTLRVSNIEAKADVSSPSVNEKVKVTNSNGELLIHIDGATSGITTVGISTSGESFRFDSNQNVTFFGSVTGTGLDVNGNADISGNLNVGGVLTYEDVTNIDSVGVVTARSGLQVTGGVSTFATDVSIADKIIHTGDTNTAIRFPAADTFSVETAGSERLRVDSSGRLLVGTDSTIFDNNFGIGELQVTDKDGYQHVLFSGHSAAAANATCLSLGRSRGTQASPGYLSSGDHIARFSATSYNGGNYQSSGCIDFYAADQHASNDLPGYISFKTVPDSTSTLTERLRIASDGAVIVGTDTTVNPILRVLGTSAHNSFIQFADGDSNNVGQLQYSHSLNALIFAVNGGEKLRIISNGNIGIDDQNPGDKLSISGGNLGIYNTGNNHGNVYFYKDGTAKGWLKYRGNDDKLVIGNVTDAINVITSGNVGVGNADPTQAKFVAQTASGMSIAAVKDNTGASISLGGVTQPRILIEAGASASQLKLYTASGSSYSSAGWRQRLLLTDTSASVASTGNGANGIGCFGIADPTPDSRALALSIGGGNGLYGIEDPRPLVYLQRSYGIGGGSSTEETTLEINAPGSYNSAGVVHGIKSYVRHNLNGSHYAGHFENYGSQYSANGTSALYAKTTKLDTNGGGDVIAFRADASITTGIANNGAAIAGYFASGNNINGKPIVCQNGYTTNSYSNQIIFRKHNGSGIVDVGSIKSNNTATQYNTSSDYRLKENIVSLTGAIDRLKQLQPKRFNFIGIDETIDGFIAHEVNPVAPYAVSGEKDAVKKELMLDEDGKEQFDENGEIIERQVIDPQGVDYSKLVTLAIAALQEEIARREALEDQYNALADRITALEP